MKTLQLVLFDLDDTLFDHQHSRRRGLLALQHAHPPLAQVPLEALVAEHERQITLSYDHVLDGILLIQVDRRERFRRLFRQCGMEISAAEAEDAVHRYRREYESHRRVVPGVLPLLEYLSNLRPRVCLGVVTNGLRAVQQEKLAACQLEGLLDFLLTSEEAGVKKPDPRLFHLALERGNARAQTAVVIGDSWELDVLGAHQAGISSLWLNRGQDACPDATLTRELCAFEPLEDTLKALEAACV